LDSDLEAFGGKGAESLTLYILVRWGWGGGTNDVTTTTIKIFNKSAYEAKGQTGAQSVSVVIES